MSSTPKNVREGVASLASPHQEDSRACEDMEAGAVVKDFKCYVWQLLPYECNVLCTAIRKASNDSKSTPQPPLLQGLDTWCHIEKTPKLKFIKMLTQILCSLKLPSYSLKIL